MIKPMIKNIINVCLLITNVVCHRVPYQFDPTIHTLGNVGGGGLIHAVMSPTCTWLIDQIAYSGINVRSLIKTEFTPNRGTLDLGAGTGFSSTDYGISVDTSKEMLGVAALIQSKNRRYMIANAETVNIPTDYVTCMFLLHEVPRENRLKIIENAINNARKRTVIADIHESYIPSKEMLKGEPYIFDYLANNKIDVVGVCHKMNKKVKYEEIIPGHVQAWIIE